MKGVIYYYSSTGNTKLACEYIATKLEKETKVKFDTFNIIRNSPPGHSGYDVVGFASPTDWLGPPFLVEKFVRSLPNAHGTPAFVLITYGRIAGKALRTLGELASAQGFDVFAGYGLHMPENFPPLVAGGKGFEGAPNEKECAGFYAFSEFLVDSVRRLSEGKKPEKRKLKIGLVNAILPKLSREKSKKEMGMKYVSEELCKGCGACARACPYEAIAIEKIPKFDESKCYGCWTCFNKCPNMAIYTTKLKGKGQYPRPLEALRDKLAIVR